MQKIDMQKVNPSAPIRFDVEANNEWRELLPIIKKDFPLPRVMVFLYKKWTGGQKQVVEAQNKAWLEASKGGRSDLL